MIKAEANVIGTIKRSANIRTDKNNNPYLSFVMTVVLTDAKTTSKSIDVFVSRFQTPIRTRRSPMLKDCVWQ